MGEDVEGEEEVQKLKKEQAKKKKNNKERKKGNDKQIWGVQEAEGGN